MYFKKTIIPYIWNGHYVTKVFSFDNKNTAKQWESENALKSEKDSWFAKKQERASISISLGKLIATVRIGWMAEQVRHDFCLGVGMENQPSSHSNNLKLCILCM